jgi:hypothetical protein
LDFPEEKQQRIFLLEQIKIECDRLEWTQEILKRNFKLIFPCKSGTDSLSDSQLQQFWEHLEGLKIMKVFIKEKKLLIILLKLMINM